MKCGICSPPSFCCPFFCCSFYGRARKCRQTLLAQSRRLRSRPAAKPAAAGKAGLYSRSAPLRKGRAPAPFRRGSHRGPGRVFPRRAVSPPAGEREIKRRHTAPLVGQNNSHSEWGGCFSASKPSQSGFSPSSKKAGSAPAAANLILISNKTA